jgi:predicted secreted hydrolase
MSPIGWMKTLLLLVLALLSMVEGAGAEWQIAKPGWRYEFPKDHGIHPGFKTEWWYFTGNLRDRAGREFGYQLTFFRQGVLEPGSAAADRSRFLVNDFKFAHFALSDLGARRFHHTQKLSRGAFGEAGFAEGGRTAWIGDWQLAASPGEGWELQAKAGANALRLRVLPAKPPVIHGAEGISRKAEGEGRASHYYSFTRLKTEGELVLDGETRAVSGESWFDHEWATNQLTAEQAGWNWFSLQLGDGSELMLYQMRLRNGGIDPVSSGTFVAENGASEHLRVSDYELVPVRFWTSGKTKAPYPIAWRLRIRKLGIEGEIRTPLESQELTLEPIAYWEGAIRFSGRGQAGPLSGKGYMELTGYNAPLTGLGAR